VGRFVRQARRKSGRVFSAHNRRFNPRLSADNARRHAASQAFRLEQPDKIPANARALRFFYGFLHLITYSIFDKSFSPSAIASDVWERPFIAVGMLAFFLLVPLAATSTNGMIKRLGGKNWARIHKATYFAAILGVVHFWMIVKSDIFYPLLFALVLAYLLGYRFYAANEKPKKVITTE